jgi:hypothetical protein
MNKTVICLAMLGFLLPLNLASAQKKAKPWTEWSKQDTEKVLSDSAWAQTQTDTDTSQRLYSRSSGPALSADRVTAGTNARLARGAITQEINIKFQVRFFSARPVRQALARLMELELDHKSSPGVAAKLHGFAEMKSGKSIIVTLTFDSSDRGYFGSITQALNTGTTGLLKNRTYLERTDGKRLFLEEYVPPGKDGFGARFIFQREVDGAPFLNADSGVVRFHADYPVGLEIDRRFKVADMVYNGELEY